MAPVRRCVGCGHSDEKNTLLRVTVSEGRAVVDDSASAPGRGAYVHRRPECVEQSIHRRAWARALKIARVDALDLENIAKHAVADEEKG
ncbi:MAG: hypothetical protein CBC58_00890 [Cellulomonadaceae bacterium TMED98]|jgi:Predicted nucleic-acid-binding protein implicated in transcription termination|nr:MAG: hypothetical protein CBC58_00890 [Cellulomonadaceae bacterium TMED98]